MMYHLNENTRAIALLDDATRVQWILSEKWIGYTRAMKILSRMEELLQYPKCLRMPNLLLIGPSNNGKTLLLNKFCERHKPEISLTDGHINAPVIYIQSPPRPNERVLYTTLLDKLNIPHRIHDHVDRKQQQVLTVLKKIDTKILILDEIHHILAGSNTNQRGFLNVIKYLGNELQIVIIGAGVKEAYNAINTDTQLSNRFEPAILPRWKMDDEYLRLLASFESVLPLKKPSCIAENDELLLKILSMSEGVIGEITTVLKKAAIIAIKSKAEYICKGVLDKIDYISPSGRRKQFESVS